MKTLVPFVSLKPLEEKLSSVLDDAYERVRQNSSYIRGTCCREFEEKFAAYCGTRYCVGVGNGLDALTLILLALGIKEGDEVLVPGNTFIATVLAVTRTGATPVPVEPDESTYTIDPEQVGKAISSKTKAMIAVHLYGQPCNMEALAALCKEKGIFLVEDCAQAHGATYRGRRVGSFGIAAGFSFYPTKNLGALGDGGAVVTDSGELEAKVRALGNYGSIEKYHSVYQGMNSRLDELQAAFLEAKLEYLAETNDFRKKVAGRYRKEIRNPQVLLPEVSKETDPVWHIFAIRTKRREEFREYLQKKGIETAVHYPVPPHKQPCYREMNGLSLPITEQISETEVSLPMYYGMSKEAVDAVIAAVNEYSEEKKRNDKPENGVGKE